MRYLLQIGFNNQFQKNPEDEFDKLTGQFDSTIKWGLAASLVMSVVIIIAIVAIVYAIIDCLKKTGSALPAYASISNKDVDEASDRKSSTDQERFSGYQLSKPSGDRFATVERILSNLAKEKPIRFSPQEIEEFTDNFSKKLGSGGYGVVYKGELPNGVFVAVKLLNNHLDNKKLEEQFIAEISTIGRTYHANLVRLYGFCLDSSMIALVYEYMSNGSLDKLLFDENRPIEWLKLSEIAIGTAKGIAYLHEECERTIVHYDIKPENILLDDSLNPKVADFGLAKLCNRTEGSKVALSGGRGTLGYSAPEVWYRNYPVTYKCDVYSFGILLFEIIGRRRQFEDKLTESRQWLPRWAWDMYKNNELKVLLSLCGIEESNRDRAEKMCNVALLCIQHSPFDRPRMSDVVKMLEGSMEILHLPQNPFEYNGTNMASNTGSQTESGSIASAAGTDMAENPSKQCYLASKKDMAEIELASR